MRIEFGKKTLAAAILSGAAVLFKCGPGLDTLSSPVCGGAPAWAGTFETGQSATTLGVYASATDCAGNVFVAGQTNVALPGYTLKDSSGDYFLMKISSSGQKAWVFEDGAVGGNVAMAPLAVAVDGLGNVYVTGKGQGNLDGLTGHALSGHTDYFLSKFDYNGNLVWTVLDGPGGSKDAYSTGIAIAGSSDVYLYGNTGASIDGQSYVSVGAIYDFFLTRYSASSGTLVKTVENGIPVNGLLAGNAAFDSSGLIYVTGVASGGSVDGNALAGTGGVFVSVYDSSLNRQWTNTFSPTTGISLAPPPFIAVDSANRKLYVTSNPTGAGAKYPGVPSHVDGPNLDAALSQLDFQGNLGWSVQDGPGGGLQGKAYCVVLDGAGNPYLLGGTAGGVDGNTQHLAGGTDYFISRYDTAGNRAWTVQDGITGGGPSFYFAGFSLGIDAGGNLYFSGAAQATPGGAGMDGNTQIGTVDAFVTQYNGAGQRI